MMNLRERVKLFLKGMSMGAADVVPGVSGGTIAFISGIYEELLGSIKSIGPDTLKALRQGGFKGCLLYTSPSPRDRTRSRIPPSA